MSLARKMFLGDFRVILILVPSVRGWFSPQVGQQTSGASEVHLSEVVWCGESFFPSCMSSPSIGARRSGGVCQCLANV